MEPESYGTMEDGELEISSYRAMEDGAVDMEDGAMKGGAIEQ